MHENSVLVPLHKFDAVKILWCVVHSHTGGEDEEVQTESGASGG